MNEIAEPEAAVVIVDVQVIPEEGRIIDLGVISRDDGLEHVNKYVSNKNIYQKSIYLFSTGHVWIIMWHVLFLSKNSFLRFKTL